MCHVAGRPLGRGGLWGRGGVAVLDCFNDPGIGDETGGVSASSDPDAERNSGYGWRR